MYIKLTLQIYGVIINVGRGGANAWYMEVASGVLIDAPSLDQGSLRGVSYILLTHSHVGHVRSLAEVVRIYRPIIIGNPIELAFLQDLERLARYIRVVAKRAGASLDAAALAREMHVPLLGAKVYRMGSGNADLLEVDVEVLPCGGHSWGSTCYRVGGVVFVGDLGRPWVSIKSLTGTLATLKGLNAVAYPGHGEPVNARELAIRVENELRGAAKLYLECLAEGPPVRTTSCVFGEAMTPLEYFRALEETLAFVGFFVEEGMARVGGAGTWKVSRAR